MTSLPPSAQQPTTELPEPGTGAPGATEAPVLVDAPYTVPVTTMAVTNAYAVIAVILAFIQPLAGIVFGHMSLGQIKRSGEAGRGLALTALIVGYVMVAGVVLAIVAYIAIFAIMLATVGAAAGNLGGYDFGDAF